MDDTSGREFVDAIIDATPTRLDADFRKALHRQTQGHPLFTVELLRDLRERGVIINDGDGREVLSQPVNWQALPIKAEAVIAERIGRLPQQLQRVLKVASVEGQDLTAEVVARIENIDEREIIRLLSEEADRRHQLVQALDVRRAGAQRLSVYRFRHILFQKYLYQSLDRVERSYLHESVGKTLETLLGNKADVASVSNRKMLEILWNHAIASATVARNLAKREGHPTEDAFMAGLLHGIGRLLVLRALDRLSQLDADLSPTQTAIDELVDALQYELGYSTLHAWNFSEDICEAARAMDPEADPPSSPMIQIVQAADLIAQKLSLHPHPEPDLNLMDQDAIESLELRSAKLSWRR